jgi:redox-sensitive bicupin YhaK (pirin superfamily)
MEIISVLLKGKMNHIDSLGYKTVIEEGGVQIMSAGIGLRHEEYNIGEEEVNFLQIWIQPKLQNIEPRQTVKNLSPPNKQSALINLEAIVAVLNAD